MPSVWTPCARGGVSETGVKAQRHAGDSESFDEDLRHEVGGGSLGHRLREMEHYANVDAALLYERESVFEGGYRLGGPYGYDGLRVAVERDCDRGAADLARPADGCRENRLVAPVDAVKNAERRNGALERPESAQSEDAFHSPDHRALEKGDALNKGVPSPPKSLESPAILEEPPFRCWRAQ